jgi:hypothetical protein
MTHGRADTISTPKVVPDVILCVAESQYPLYKETHPDSEFLVHPDSVKGISPKRQWLMDHVEEDVVMMDDDMVAFVDVSAAADAGTAWRLGGDEIRDVCTRARDTAEQMGAYLFGFSSYVDPALFRPQKPFNLTGMVSGNALGLRQSSNIWFPDTVELLTDDLWISALNAYEHRFIFQDMRYAVANKGTWVGKGGMATYRTWDRVVANEQRLKDAFGDGIRRRGDTARSKLKVEIQLQLEVPW